jgi:hypothetical protein
MHKQSQFREKKAKKQIPSSKNKKKIGIRIRTDLLVA